MPPSWIVTRWLTRKGSELSARIRGGEGLGNCIFLSLPFPSSPIFSPHACSLGKVSGPRSNLRSYSLSLYLDAGEEGMIHLLVGSYVQKPDSFFSRIGRETILVQCHISTRLPARSWSENGMLRDPADEASFCEDEFSFAFS